MLPVSMLSSTVPGPREGESAAARHPPYAPLLDPAGQGSGASAAAPGPRPALQPAGRGSGASARRALAALACTRAAADRACTLPRGARLCAADGCPGPNARRRESPSARAVLPRGSCAPLASGRPASPDAVCCSRYGPSVCPRGPTPSS